MRRLAVAAVFALILMAGYPAAIIGRLDEAQGRLQKALALQADNTEAKILLAEVFYRRDNFVDAAKMLAGLDPGKGHSPEANTPPCRTGGSIPSRLAVGW
jgi:thioredoxin-like negative regulator of GroEL